MHCEAQGFFHVQRRNQNGARTDGDRRNVRFFLGPKHHRFADGRIGRRGKFSNQRDCARSSKPRHPQRSQRRAQCLKSRCATAARHQCPDDNAISLIFSNGALTARPLDWTALGIVQGQHAAVGKHGLSCWPQGGHHLRRRAHPRGPRQDLFHRETVKLVAGALSMHLRRRPWRDRGPVRPHK
jgi:hypothetical protein